ALHSPADLGLALLTAAGHGPSWTWLRWLPHLVDESAVSAGHGPAWTVLIVDRADAGVVDFRSGGAAIWLAESRQQLPSACATVVTVAGDTGALLQVE